MGLVYHDARQLLRARASGHRFGSVVTIGRQLSYLQPHEAEALAVEFDRPGGWTQTALEAPADAFFTEALGATSVEAIDVSDYEGAGIVHDMNRPIDLAERFDTVFDGGCLEHIFNVAAALANLMRLARVDGAVFITTPSNNLSGHGFYQFSPELMYRVFTRDRGFDLCEVSIAEYDTPYVDRRPALSAWRVVDPAVVGERVNLMSPHAALLWVHARKIAHVVDPFATMPQQSDYVARWNSVFVESSGSRSAAAWKGLVYRMLPKPVRDARRRYLEREALSTANGRFYSRLDAS